MGIFKQYAKKDNMIRRKVKGKIVKTDGEYKFDYKFEFDFIIGPDKKKRAIVAINNNTVVLDQGQSCIYILMFEDRDPIRIKVKPDFEKEGCHTISCIDPKIKDEDI